jgi:hypothetical protein
MNDEPDGWEYQTIMVAGPYNQYCLVELEASGKEGWELVQVNEGGIALMRRRRAVVEIKKLHTERDDLRNTLLEAQAEIKKLHTDRAELVARLNWWRG